MHTDNKIRQLFARGLKDGFPICLGYFAVAFSLGIAAGNAGFETIQGFLMSLFNNASAGEYAGIVVIAASGTYGEMALMTLVANARYMLMSCALSQRIDPDTPFCNRLLLAHGITDELFGLCIARPGYVRLPYAYGALLIAEIGWAFGTLFGVIAGDVLPALVVSALSVALFGMFIAVIVPPAKADRAVLICVVVSFILSFAATKIDLLAQISDGSRTIILTVIISAAAAILFPRSSNTDENTDVKEAA